MLRSTSGSTSSDLAKGKKFIKKLLYVQHVDKERDTVSETSDRYLEEFLLANRTNFYDSNFTEYLKSPKENLSMLKSSMEDSIEKVTIYSNPLPIPLKVPGVTFHAFVVFKTERFRWFRNSEETWWSLEKNGHHIVLQQSPNKDDVINKIYDTEKKTSVERLGPIQKQKSYLTFEQVRDLMRIIVDTNKINERYHLLYSNCQHFASFVFEKMSRGREKWSTVTSATFGRIGLKKKRIQPKIKVDAFKYQSIVNDEKFYVYRAMMEGRRKDFEELTNDLTIECLNSVDSQGYTLLEWATVFSSSDWPIAELLIKDEKGPELPWGERKFRRNVFSIALRYLPNKKKQKLFYLSDGVNKTDDNTALPYLYGKKWDIVEKILNNFEDDDYNTANSLGETALILAAEFKCEDKLFAKILQRTNPENINAQDEGGFTALHWAIDNISETKVEELLNRNDVDVNIKNNRNETALHLASSKRKDFPFDLFKLILEKSTDINALNEYGFTALHCAIRSEIATKALFAHEKVDVNVKNNNGNETPLHLASEWRNIPFDLFKIILEKSTDINSQDQNGYTALLKAISGESEITTKELLQHSDVNVDLKNNRNETALHLASKWPTIPSDLFNLILEKSMDVINAQDKDGNTPLHIAIGKKFESATKALLAHNDVDVNIKNNENKTALHLACLLWPTIPADLFKIILEKSTDINAQDNDGWTALHCAIRRKSEIATKELLARNDVDVNVNNETALHLASHYWKDIPSHFFKIISERSINQLRLKQLANG